MENSESVEAAGDIPTGTQVTVTCKTSYQLVSDGEKALCTDEGEWSNPSACIRE